MPTLRQLNIELLRVFSMLLIFLWHIGGHFMLYVPAEADVSSSFINYVTLFITFHVDIFVLITGYFGIRKRTGAFVKTIFLCIFYAFIFNLIVTMNGGSFCFSELLMPLSKSPWWFLKVYMLLVLIAPVIEKYINGASNREFYSLLGITILIDVYFGFFLHLSPYNNHGYDIFNFLLVYLLGCLLRRDDKLIAAFKERPLLPALTFLTCCAIRYKVQPITSLTWTDYNSPLNLLMALSVFCLFLKLKVSDKLTKPIVFLSSSAVAVYLITDYKGIRDLIAYPFVLGMQETNDSVILQILFIFTFIIISFVLCCFVDKLRIVITKPINNTIISRLASKR